MVAEKKQARKFPGHQTNKAFDRYCQIADEESYDMTQMMVKKRGKIVEFREVKGDKK